MSSSHGRKLRSQTDIPHFFHGTQSSSQCSYESISVPHHQPIYPPIIAQVSSPEVTLYTYLACAALTPFKIQLQCYTVNLSYNEFKYSIKMYYINLNFIITDLVNSCWLCTTVRNICTCQTFLHTINRTYWHLDHPVHCCQTHKTDYCPIEHNS
jgi:hypothetical protein